LNVHLQLLSNKIVKLIVGLSYELFGAEESIDQEPSTADLPRHPRACTSVEFALRHDMALHSTDAGPVVNFKHADSIKQDLNDAAAEVVRDNKIRVELMELADESFQHHSLVQERRNVRMTLLFDALLQVRREWQRVKFSDQREVGDPFVVSCLAVDRHSVLHEERDHCDFIRVVGIAEHLCMQGHRGQGRW